MTTLKLESLNYWYALSYGRGVPTVLVEVQLPGRHGETLTGALFFIMM
jgi:hypothetical protein